MNPPNFRVIFEKQTLSEIFKVTVLTPPSESNLITRNFFLRKKLLNLLKNNLPRIIIVYDLLTLLFLNSVLKKHRKKQIRVIYEMIDDFSYYYSYKLIKNKINIIGYKIFSNLEKKLLSFVDFVIVNSPHLFDKVKNKYNFERVELIYYTSPYENLSPKNNPILTSAFIYIGQFSLEKGAKEVFALAEKFPTKRFYIVGDNRYKNVSNLRNVIFLSKGERIHYEKIRIILSDLLSKYFLWGLSIIPNFNKSFFRQEANKDIEYLSLGIPIIGNNRPGIRNKLESVLFVENLSNNNIDDLYLKKKLSHKALEVYYRLFCNECIRKKILKVVSEIL